MANEKILVTGSSGLVGSRFVELFSQPEKLLIPGENDLDITNKKSVDDYFQKHKPTAVLHLAAFTDVNAAENQRGDESGICWKVNVIGTKNLLAAAKKSSCYFVHISTDMVFPGTKDYPGPYREDQIPPEQLENLTWYGYSKLMAEQLVPVESALVRIIYPVRAFFGGKLDYLRKPLKLYDDGKLYPMFSDQHVSISFVDEIVVGLSQILSDRLVGIYHLSSSDTSTPFALATELIKKARGVSDAVKPSSVDDFLAQTDKPYRYPKYGGLDSSQTAKKLGIKFSSCFEIISELVRQGISV